jgi:hypothetical protein
MTAQVWPKKGGDGTSAGERSAALKPSKRQPARKASRQSLTKKTPARDDGEAFDTGFVMNFSIFEGGLFQT